jgi:hypothetical protein
MEENATIFVSQKWNFGTPQGELLVHLRSNVVHEYCLAPTKRVIFAQAASGNGRLGTYRSPSVE